MANRVLVVDGDPHSRLLMEVGLSASGLWVEPCATLEDAERVLSRHEVDLLVGEVDLPDAEPFALARLKENHPRLLDTPLLFITTRRAVEDKITGLERGAEDYLTKPIYLREFVTRVTGYLRRQEVTRLTPRGLRAHYKGRLSPDLVHDIVRSMLDAGQAGRLELLRRGRPGRLTFAQGELVNAEVDRVDGEEAALRLLLWETGEFEVYFEPVLDRTLIGARTEAVIDLSLRRRQQWERLLSLCPEFRDLALPDVLALMDLAVPRPEGLDALLGLFDLTQLSQSSPPDPARLAVNWPELARWVRERLRIAGRTEAPPDPDLSLETDLGPPIVMTPPPDFSLSGLDTQPVDPPPETSTPADPLPALPGLERPEAEPPPRRDEGKDRF